MRDSIAVGLLVSLSAFGQIIKLQATPEPMAVTSSLKLKSIGRWKVDGCVSTAATDFSLPIQRVTMAFPQVAFLSPADANTVLTTQQSRSFWSVFLVALSWAGKGGSIALAVISKSNIAWSTGIGIGFSALPEIVRLAQGQVPSVAPFLSTLEWPLKLAPGDCFTEHLFAAKMKNPQPVQAVVDLGSTSPRGQ
jgi:hypothetical protein